MTYWGAYCDSSIRAGYKRLLLAEGNSARDVEDIMDKFGVYITRIKGTSFAAELDSIDNRAEFLDKLNDIFLVKWKDHIKDSYRIVYSHFVDYLDYLEIAQASRGEYINVTEKASIERSDFQYPAENLTELEIRFVKNGKVKALVNPTLICLLRKQFTEQGRQKKSAGLMCKTYYQKVLPAMTASDCLKLIDDTWASKDRVRAAGTDRKFRITFPGNTKKVLSLTEGLKEIILYFGSEMVKSKKVSLRNNDLVVKLLPLSGKDNYIEIGDGYYMFIQGNYKDKYNVANLINTMFGRPLKIELI